MSQTTAPSLEFSTPAPVDAPACVSCGDPARVRVHEGYRAGEPVVRTFCLDCATDNPKESTPRRSHRRLGLPTLIGIAGLILGLFAATADVLVPEAAAGFGLHQKLAVLLGVVMGLLGTLLRVDLLALAGLFVLIVAVSVDHFGVVRNWGFGWQQQMLLAAAALCLLVAVGGHVLRRWRSVGTPAFTAEGGPA